MNYVPSSEIIYPETEREKLADLSSLFSEWFEFTRSKSFSREYSANDLVFDGFYPFYFDQKVKILFVGRESRGLSGCNYIEALFKAYKNKVIGKQHINSAFLHKRLMYITYGLNRDFADWNDIPFADKIVESFGVKRGISCAFMNISKFSNEGKRWESDWELINASFAASRTEGKNLIQAEVEILSPDVIITMHLGDKIKALGSIELLDSVGSVSAYRVDISGRKRLLLDTFHFSALDKDDRIEFYEPICENIKKYPELL
ncbi:MAG: hypothetical protein KF713_13365 [Turneriella sp.]|nr:hypothetical protein [Turneriella sp.]